MIIKNAKNKTVNVTDSQNITINVIDCSCITVNLTDSKKFTVNITDDQHYTINTTDLKSFGSYKPKIVRGKVSNTGWPIDGHTLVLSLWDYDDHESWHLFDWSNDDEQALMETMFITETKAGMCRYDTLDEFAGHWDKWEPQGVFCIPLDNVDILEVIQEEQKRV